jgi:hypothetical protein
VALIYLTEIPTQFGGGSMTSIRCFVGQFEPDRSKQPKLEDESSTDVRCSTEWTKFGKRFAPAKFLLDYGAGRKRRCPSMWTWPGRRCRFWMLSLAKANVKVLHLHGDEDTLVPTGANSEELARRHRELLSSKLCAAPPCGNN